MVVVVVDARSRRQEKKGRTRTRLLSREEWREVGGGLLSRRLRCNHKWDFIIAVSSDMQQAERSWIGQLVLNNAS